MKGFRECGLFPNLYFACGLIYAVGGALVGLGSPAQAQSAPSEQQVMALSEALRSKADEGPGLDTGVYYSDWQVESLAIPKWSQACLGRSLTPLEFATSPKAAESVVLCQLQKQLTNQYQATGGNESVAVQRVVSWWRTGDASRYQSSEVSPFAQDILGLYEQTLAKADSDAEPGGLKPEVATTSFYDRYMSAGYGAMRNSELSQAAAYFQRALDERPQDTFAQTAFRDVMRQARSKGIEEVAKAQEVASVNSQHWTEVDQNAWGDRTLVGPNSISAVGDRWGYWEYRTFASENNAFLPVTMDQPVRSALLYRLASCDAGIVQTRVMKAYGDGRTELFNQNFGVAAPLETPKANSTTAQAIAFICDQATTTKAIEEASLVREAPNAEN